MALQDLHVLATNSEGVLWHTFFSNGSWQSFFGNVQSQNGGQGVFSDVACSITGQFTLNVIALNSDGHQR